MRFSARAGHAVRRLSDAQLARCVRVLGVGRRWRRSDGRRTGGNSVDSRALGLRRLIPARVGGGGCGDSRCGRRDAGPHFGSHSHETPPRHTLTQHAPEQTVPGTGHRRQVVGCGIDLGKRPRHADVRDYVEFRGEEAGAKNLQTQRQRACQPRDAAPVQAAFKMLRGAVEAVAVGLSEGALGGGGGRWGRVSHWRQPRPIRLRFKPESERSGDGDSARRASHRRRGVSRPCQVPSRLRQDPL